jgi:hypothetical protein
MRDKIQIKSEEKISAQAAPPKLFSASQGDADGEINLQWDRVRDAHFYILQICLFQGKNSKWIQLDVITKSNYTIAGLKSRRKYGFRISAVNTSGQGPWSKVIKKNVA